MGCVRRQVVNVRVLAAAEDRERGAHPGKAPQVLNGRKLRRSVHEDRHAVGEGEAGRNGGPPGDLYVEIRVNPHKLFDREGSDLSTEVPISMATATLGGEVELPTLNGHVSLKIPAGTQSGKVFRLRGKGVTTVRDARQGDLFAKVAVETPVNLSADQRDILQKFDKSIRAGGEKHSPRAGGWLDTVKRFFDRISQ